MLARTTSLVYLGRDNVIDLVLLADDEPVALSPVTRVVLSLDETKIVDSNTVGLGSGLPFEIRAGTYGDETVDLLRLRLGGQTITTGRYQARLTLYDPDHPNGLVWTEALHMVITA